MSHGALTSSVADYRDTSPADGGGLSPYAAILTRGCVRFGAVFTWVA